MGGRPKIEGPFFVRGVEYQSLTEIGQALGLRHSTVYSSFRRGALDTLGLAKARIDKCLPFTVRRRTFETFDACAEHFGLRVRHVRQMVLAGRAKYIGLPPHRTRKQHGCTPMRTNINGEIFESAKAAAAAKGVAEVTIRVAIDKGREQFVGVGRSRAHRVSSTDHPMEFGPLKFKSMSAASAALGMNKGYVRGVVQSDSLRRKKGLARRLSEYAKAMAEKA